MPITRPNKSDVQGSRRRCTGAALKRPIDLHRTRGHEFSTESERAWSVRRVRAPRPATAPSRRQPIVGSSAPPTPQRARSARGSSGPARTNAPAEDSRVQHACIELAAPAPSIRASGGWINGTSALERAIAFTETPVTAKRDGLRPGHEASAMLRWKRPAKLLERGCVRTGHPSPNGEHAAVRLRRLPRSSPPPRSGLAPTLETRTCRVPKTGCPPFSRRWLGARGPSVHAARHANLESISSP